MSERRLVECSLRLMTPSPSWCLLRRFEKVLSSLSTFGPESTLASSFQNGSLEDIMTDLRSLKVSPFHPQDYGPLLKGTTLKPKAD